MVKEIATILKSYKLRKVSGDRYAAGWVLQRFEAEGIKYKQSKMDKSTAYIEMQPLFAQGRIEILDHPQLIRELKLLERRPRAGGKDLVDHPRNQHDDYSNSLALVAAEVIKRKKKHDPRNLRFTEGARKIPAHEYQPDQFTNRGSGMPRTKHRSGWGFE